jgi:hypothetical protein
MGVMGICTKPLARRTLPRLRDGCFLSCRVERSSSRAGVAPLESSGFRRTITTVTELSTLLLSLRFALCEALNMRGKLILCAILAVLGTRITVAQTQSGCALPDGLSPLIASKFPNTHIVSLSDLSQDDKMLFQKEHGSSCPGLTRVDFYGDGKPTLALVLLSTNGVKNAQLVVAQQVEHQWQTRLVDTAGASVPVVWSEKPGKYDDVYGQKTLNATRPVVVLCEYESWAILYAWTGKRVNKIWISD